MRSLFVYGVFLTWYFACVDVCIALHVPEVCSTFDSVLLSLNIVPDFVQFHCYFDFVEILNLRCNYVILVYFAYNHCMGDAESNFDLSVCLAFDILVA